MAIIEIVPGSIRLQKMNDVEYFALKGYISNSKLGLINPDEGGSPENYVSGFKGGYSESFELGTAIHSMVLQPEFYHIAEINKPTGKLGVWAEQVYKLRQEGLTIKQATTQASIDADYYTSKFSDTRFKTAVKGSLDFYLKRMKFEEVIDKQVLFLSKPMQLKFEQCMLGVASNQRMLNILNPEGLLTPVEVFNEYAIFCEIDYIDEDTGEITRLKLKAKLDNFTIDHELELVTLNDLKSSGKPSKFFMGNEVTKTNEVGEQTTEWYDGSFQKYHYGRQCALYLWMLQCAMKEIYNLSYKSKVNILVIETIPDFKSRVCVIKGKDIKAGLNEFKNLITLVVKNGLT